MHPVQYSFLALEISRERTLEAEARSRYAEALAGRAAGPGLARRLLTRAVAGVSRASTLVARRLDAALTEAERRSRHSTGA
jgi:hypothetical protein